MYNFIHYLGLWTSLHKIN